MLLNFLVLEICFDLRFNQNLDHFAKIPFFVEKAQY